MSRTLTGIHHVTAICGSAQQNLTFYADVLGLRFVKRTVNFDDPGTYHLYYGDEVGRPGSILTFFPWPDAVPGRGGTGMVQTTSFSVPEGSFKFWQERLEAHDIVFERPVERFGTRVLQFSDPDGLPLELVSHAGAGQRPGWPDGPVPAEHALRSFHGITIGVTEPDRTAHLLTEVFGYEDVGAENGRHRFRSAGDAPAAVIDLEQSTERGRMGRGAVHHVAFRAANEEEQQRWREVLLDEGYDVTPVRDRRYFRSIYFREPGGVLFEIATDGPGFTTDEDRHVLGTALKLPPWLEERRADIEQQLPALEVSPSP